MSVVLCAAAATSPHQREKLTWRFITCRTNAGGLGTIGAIGMSPEGLRAECKKLRSMLQPGDAIGGTLPYGVDLLLPQVGGDARKTNKDYTGGQLEALVDVMLDEQNRCRSSSALSVFRPCGWLRNYTAPARW